LPTSNSVTLKLQSACFFEVPGKKTLQYGAQIRRRPSCEHVCACVRARACVRVRACACGCVCVPATQTLVFNGWPLKELILIYVAPVEH